MVLRWLCLPAAFFVFGPRPQEFFASWDSTGAGTSSQVQHLSDRRRTWLQLWPAVAGKVIVPTRHSAAMPTTCCCTATWEVLHKDSQDPCLQV